MRTAIYVRVSTEEQSQEGYSISAQKERCTRFIESQPDWDLVKIYADPGYSAKDLKRPSMKQLIEDVEKDYFDVIVVYRLDRLVRSVLDLHHLLKLFEKNRVMFKSVTEVFDTTTAMGRFFITMVGAMAEWERNNLSERVSFGMEQMTREGKWKGGYVGFGHDRKDGEFVIVEHEAEVLRDMYKWYLEGLSDRKIAIKLNDMGITTRSGAWWTERKIRTALINKKNIGILQYGIRVNQDKYFEVENVYPPIIDKETFYKCYSVREARRSQNGRQATSDYYYSGILTCARCGTSFKGIKARGYKRYRCRGTLMDQCDMPTTAESLIDNKFVEALKKFTFNPSELVLDKNENNNQEKTDNINKEIEKIKSRRKKWQYAWANETIRDDEFQDLMKEEQEKEDYYKNKLADFQGSSNQIIDASMLDTMKTAVDNWHLLLDAEKKQLMQIAIEKIVVEIDKEAPKEDRVTIKEIVWN